MKRRLLSLVVVGFALFGPTAAQALSLLGQLPIAGARSVSSKGDVIYVCSSSGLYIVDTQNPAQPTASTPVMAGNFQACQVSGDLLVATQGTRPFTVNVYSLKANPKNPVLLGASPSIMYWDQTDLLVSGTHAFVSQFFLCWEILSTNQMFFQGGDLLSFDLNLNNLTNPTGAAPSLAKVLFNTHGDASRNPADPFPDQCPQNGGDHHVWRIAQADANTLLLATTTVSGTNTQNGTGLIQVVDISNPSNPQTGQQLSIPGTTHALAVAVDGNRGLVVGTTDGWQNSWTSEFLFLGKLVFTVLDLTDPQNPQILGSVTSNHPSRTFWTNITSLGGGRFAFSHYGGVSGGPSEPKMFIVDVSNPSNPAVEASSIPYMLAGLNSMAYANDRLYAVYSVSPNSTPAGLQIYSLVPVVANDLSVSLSDSPDPVGVGETLTYTAQVSNNGITPLTGVQLSLSLPDSVSVVFAPDCVLTINQVDCSLGTLSAGQAVTRTIAVKPGLQGGISATASVLANETDANTTNNSATAVTAITASVALPVVDLAISFGGPRKVKLNGKPTFSLTIRNRSKTPAPQVVVSGEYPSNVKLVSLPRFCIKNELNLVSCQVGTLRGRTAKTFRLRAKATRKGLVATAATISSTAISDPNPANNSAPIAITVR